MKRDLVVVDSELTIVAVQFHTSMNGVRSKTDPEIATQADTHSACIVVQEDIASYVTPADRAERAGMRVTNLDIGSDSAVKHPYVQLRVVSLHVVTYRRSMGGKAYRPRFDHYMALDCRAKRDAEYAWLDDHVGIDYSCDYAVALEIAPLALVAPREGTWYAYQHKQQSQDGCNQSPFHVLFPFSP